GGEGGIRTPEPREGLPVFKSQIPHATEYDAHVNAYFPRVAKNPAALWFAASGQRVQLDCNLAGLPRLTPLEFRSARREDPQVTLVRGV
ncbi:MAG: hypothetical protein WBE92_08130, partial [Steroidobacteraceae bacterium]